MHHDLQNDRVISSAAFPDSVHVGRGTYWDPKTKFMTYIADERLYIGRYCSIAEDAFLATGGEHFTEKVSTWPVDTFILGVWNPSRAYRRKPDTRIGSDVWIGRSAQVFGGCTVGHGAVIGAGAVVCKDVPPFAIVVGNPAKIIRYRFDEATRADLLAIAWWDWTPEEIRARAEWFYKPIEIFISEFSAAQNQTDLPAPATVSPPNQISENKMQSLRQIAPAYSNDAPSQQAMIDILAGSWVSSFPPEMGLSAGGTAHFDQTVDNRVKEVADVFDFSGKSVCELGPLEAYQTKHLCDAGAGPVVAVEANDLAFVKCLMVKEMFNIPANFFYGSALKYLENNDKVFDVIWASGVLYHQVEPLRLLELICDRSNAFFIWTHYWKQEECAKDLTFDVDKDIVKDIGSAPVVHHYKSYVAKGIEFSGGVESGAYWLEKNIILDYVTERGFKLLHFKEQVDAPPGPVMLFFAVRS
ncbi:MULTISPECIES: CatB-related O-acetyltransferase [unclassified Methylobacterium]|uniref:CatB-related O-acetyltransferase n=1 Tax=unclassified Methylobacterium TaxID=2615210 RepID=UPI0011C2015D|nr:MULTISPECIES: CatB-related O-acetyltransferase [unclassified Methylobacterium]QEE39054.1 hypothetical protein FVA80_08940 [Methylobacterium sp. WL1]TXN56739.1 hypothetical protein FV241_14300 [Methylobacterium sp. WL2]